MLTANEARRCDSRNAAENANRFLALDPVPASPSFPATFGEHVQKACSPSRRNRRRKPTKVKEQASPKRAPISFEEIQAQQATEYSATGDQSPPVVSLENIMSEQLVQQHLESHFDLFSSNGVENAGRNYTVDAQSDSKDLLKQLVEMGFDKSKCELALQATQRWGTLEAAVEYMLTPSDSS